MWLIILNVYSSMYTRNAHLIFFSNTFKHKNLGLKKFTRLKEILNFFITLKCLIKDTSVY